MHSDLSDKEFRLIAIDPGTSKLGYAVMDSKGQILEKGIIRDKSNFRSEIEMLTRKYEPEKFILGDGTGSENIKKFLVELSAGKIEIRVVDERSSTETAKKQYFSSFLYRFQTFTVSRAGLKEPNVPGMPANTMKRLTSSRMHMLQ